MHKTLATIVERASQARITLANMVRGLPPEFDQRDALVKSPDIGRTIQLALAA